ncbi:MAG: DUF1592 domain-containing protein [Opitutus sp.]
MTAVSCNASAAFSPNNLPVIVGSRDSSVRPIRGAVALAFAIGAAAAANGADASAPNNLFDHQIKPLLEMYCYDCHGDGSHKGDVALDTISTSADIPADRETWQTVLHHVRTREMPPEDADQLPSDSERELLSGWIERELFHFDAAHPDPGRVTLRRLNRAEYNNTIRDLIGVDFKAANDFPPDDSGYGFDNVGDALSLPPVLLEKYLAAADKILDEAIVTDPIHSAVRHIPASLADIGFNAIGDRGDGWVHLISLEEDDASVELALPAGDYVFRVQAFATRDGGALKGQGSETPIVFTEDPGPTRLALMLNDAFVQDFVVSTDEAHPSVYEARIGVPAGTQRFRASVARKRGGAANEQTMLNGRIGQQQPGIVFVKWLEIEGPLPAATRRTPAEKLAATGIASLSGSKERVLKNQAEVAMPFTTRRDCEVILRAQAYARQAGDEPAKMELRVDGRPLTTFGVLAPAALQPIAGQRVFSHALLAARPYVYETRVQVPAGAHLFSAVFVNGFSDPKATNPNLRERELVVQHLEIADPSEPIVTPDKPAPIAALFAAVAPAKRSLLAEAKPKQIQSTSEEVAQARAILGPFARRAWRRPVASAELDRLLKLYSLARDQGDGFDASVKLAMKAVIVSPHFLFLGHGRATPSAPTNVQRVATASTSNTVAVAAQPITDVALASRLSYFLWSSLPDDELLDLAERGELRSQLRNQVRRMLASPKSRALVDNFAGQWLQIRSLETFQPDRKLFPTFDPSLRTAMQRETELFFEHVLRADRSVFDFLTGDYTFVNARLARFYGLPEITGEEFRQVSLAATPRRGVLTQGSVLTLTSNPTRTSPVKRGKWVLENLLGTPPPPPPANIPELDDKSRQLTGTLRQQMEQHRKNATCASCHARMDPIGFGLENFDAIGAWRDRDGDAPIDASGKLGQSDRFAGAVELTTLLAKNRQREFLHCLAEKLLTYALGRGTEFYDRPALEKIIQAASENDYRFSALILGVVESFPFQMERTHDSDAKPPAQTHTSAPVASVHR